jgi:ornithine cyclodeaminase
MKFEQIGFEAEAFLTWQGITDALRSGHQMPKAEIGDTFLYRGKDTLLNRAAWIDGLGQLVKCATIFPENSKKNLPSVNGAVTLYSDLSGQLEAVIDFHLVTKWKTAGDSLLAAKLLARPDAKDILIIGAGTVAQSMVSAYQSHWPDARYTVWNRSSVAAENMAAAHLNMRATQDLAGAVAQSDIICTATMSKTPIVKGEWLRAGAHLDLIGAYRPDMREVDDKALQRAQIFVDSRATTLSHIGELADYYDIHAGKFFRASDQDITIAKNGGGAHLDLMSATYILQAWRERP